MVLILSVTIKSGFHNFYKEIFSPVSSVLPDLLIFYVPRPSLHVLKGLVKASIEEIVHSRRSLHSFYRVESDYDGTVTGQ
jgi:hypothetical protein